MRKKSTNSLTRKLFGKKIKKQAIAIPDSATKFFEEIPVYRDLKSKRLGRIYRPRSRRNPSKN
jgi:hypothetical protein